MLAARKNKRVVTMSDVEEAKDKVMMGAERRSMVMSEEEKLTAYHEVVTRSLRTKKLGSYTQTIIPRGER